MARKPKPGDPKVAVAYLRASKEEQQLSPEAQKTAIVAWATREGVLVSSWHVDHIRSVTPIAERPGLVAALLSVREHHAGVLVVAKRDRIARDVVLAAGVEHAAAQGGAVVVSAAGEGNGNTPADGFMRTVIDGAAAYERALIKARTKAALAVRKVQGRRVGSTPYGWRDSDDEKADVLVVVPEEQAVIGAIVAMHRSGMSQRQIERELAKRGVRSRGFTPKDKSKPRREGKPLSQVQVHRILAQRKDKLDVTALDTTTALAALASLPKAAPIAPDATSIDALAMGADVYEDPVSGMRLVRRSRKT